jgi:mRNA interferase MazF
MQNENINIGERYRHYKTKDIYKVVDVAILQASDESGLDMEDCVIYRKFTENGLDTKTWVRPIKMFLEKVKNENGEEVNRFTKLENTILVTENGNSVFDTWNVLKKEIDVSIQDFNFSEKEIWWCSLGKNIGNEQDGKNNNFERPVLILKKWNSSFFIGLPLTSKNKINDKNKKYYFEYDLNELELGYIILTQIKSLSKKRLIRRMGKISNKTFFEIEKRMKGLLFKE